MNISEQLGQALAEGAVWDLVAAAKELSRYAFVAEFCRRKTARKADRGVVEGYQVIAKGKLYSYRQADGGPGVQLNPWTTPDKLYELIRRTPLGFYTRQADELRVDLLSEGRRVKKGAFAAQVRRENGDWFTLDNNRTAVAAAGTASYIAYSMIEQHFVHMREGRPYWGSGTDRLAAHEKMGLGHGTENWMEIEWRVVGPDDEALATGWRHSSVPDDYLTASRAPELVSSRNKSVGRYKGPKKTLTK